MTETKGFGLGIDTGGTHTKILAVSAFFLLLVPVSAAAQEPFLLPDAPIPEPIRYSADYFEYQGSTTGSNARIILRGNVEIVESSRTLRAAQARLDMPTRTATATGGFELDNGLSVLRGASGTFDLADRTGYMEDVRAEYQTWRIWSRKGTLDGEQKAHFGNALFTSCDGNPPHFHIRASGLHVKPRSWMYATNARFHLGKVPVFYSPFLWKSLDPKRLVRTRMRFGYDKRGGGAARSSTEFDIHPAMYSRLFLDYYTQTGIATGAEVQFKDSEDSRGALYGYRIHENATAKERWSVLGNYYRTISSSYSAQGRIQAQSDPDVNNHYVRSNAFRVTSELVNSAALVRTTSLTTTRISYSRVDERRDATNQFIVRKESTPRIDFNTAPIPIKRLPALLTFNAFADNSFDRERGFQQKTVSAGLRLTRSILLRRGLSLTPHSGFREVFEDRRHMFGDFGSTRTVANALTGFYEVGTNLRVDTIIGNWDLGYIFERRLKTRALGGDLGAPDFGQEQNLLTFQDTVRPNRKILVRFRSGYNLRKFREYDLGFRRRVEPLTSDLVYTPRPGLNLSLRSDYHLEDGNRSFLAQAEAGEREATFAGFGITYTIDRPQEYLSAMEGGWVPQGSTWKFAGALRSVVYQRRSAGFQAFRLFEKEMSIAKDFHDFLTRVLVRFRPGGVSEVMLRVDMKTDHETVRRIARKAWEKEWFPWRTTSGDDH